MKFYSTKIGWHVSMWVMSWIGLLESIIEIVSFGFIHPSLDYKFVKFCTRMKARELHPEMFAKKSTGK